MTEDIDQMFKARLDEALSNNPRITQFLGQQLRLRVDASFDWLVNPLLRNLVTLTDPRRTETVLQFLVDHLPDANSILDSIFSDVLFGGDGYLFDQRLADAQAALYPIDATTSVLALDTSYIGSEMALPESPRVDN